MMAGKIQHIAAILVLVLLPALFSSCAPKAGEQVDAASALIDERPDSAYLILSRVSFDDLDEAGKAKYILTKAMADIATNRTLVTDSLLPRAIEYYHERKDTMQWLKANVGYVWYLNSFNKRKEAIAVLDSVIAVLPSDSVDMQYQLRSIRMGLNIIIENYPAALEESDWLIYHTRFDRMKLLHAQRKMCIYFMAGNAEKAIEYGDSIVGSDYFTAEDSYERIDFLGDYAEIMDEGGRSADAIRIIEDLLRRNPGFSDEEKIGYFLSLAKFNANVGNFPEANRYLAALDTLDSSLMDSDSFHSDYIKFLRGAIRFKETGHLHGTPDNRMSNELVRQRSISSGAVEAMNDLSAKKMQLTLEKQRLWLMVLVILLALIVVATVSVWVLRRRRLRLIEAEERIDTLNEMLSQANSPDSGDKNDMLRDMILRQMGIIKTFASAPTAQNREVLKKISGVDGQNEKLVDWVALYAMVDELFDNFYSRLTAHYAGLFTDKEIQIICLMRADFSTKEIGFLTEQSSATVYVRKSAIRKKLRAPEGGDIIARIESELPAD